MLSSPIFAPGHLRRPKPVCSIHVIIVDFIEPLEADRHVLTCGQAYTIKDHVMGQHLGLPMEIDILADTIANPTPKGPDIALPQHIKHILLLKYVVCELC